MNLFIDTTNLNFIAALINNNKVVKLLKKETNRTMVKNSNQWLEDFLKNNNQEILKLEKIYFTIGPGSFTGVKVGYNIVRTLLLVNPKIKIYTISSLDLLSNKDKLHTALRITANRYVIQKKGIFTKIKDTKSIEKYDPELIQVGYKDFDKKTIETKLEGNYFKRVKDAKKINLIF